MKSRAGGKLYLTVNGRERVWRMAACCLAIALSPALAAGQESRESAGEEKLKEQRSSTVGMPARIDQLKLPGSELEVKPIVDDATPIVLRIAAVFPHGGDHRYDLVYYGLDPGKYDLRDFLRRKDGSELGELPALTVEITPVLPPGQVQPNELRIERGPFLGGYRLAWILGAVLWAAGLFAILFVGRRRKRSHEETAVRAPKTFADRLRPIVEQAVRGEISHSRLAELERLLVAFWRKRLGLDTMKAAEAIVALREHDEAGSLLQQLELWLHRPGGSHDVDIPALLEPYQNLPADALDWNEREVKPS